MAAGLLTASETASPHQIRVTRPSARRGDVQFLHLHPCPLFGGYPAVTFHGEQEPHTVVSYRLEVAHTGIPAIPGHKSGLQPPCQDFLQHVEEIIILVLPSALSYTR